MAKEDTEESRSHHEEGAREHELRALYDAVRAEVVSRATPLSTYRLQLHRGFGFQAAQDALPYLARLGVSHVYSSPQLKAQPGSMHGYDVIDHGVVNPDLGTDDDHRAFCGALRSLGMGHVLDTVPNHMGIERGNALWEDVLENGPASRCASTFDIDWDPVKPELKGKVLLPVLGDQYGVVLERGELKLEYEAGAFRVRLHDRIFPLSPRGFGDVLRLGFEALEKTLGVEHPDLVELQSVLTAIEHLPKRDAPTPEKVTERAREKEVLKRRLDELVRRNSEVLAHIERSVQRFNGTVGDPRSFDLLDALLARYSPYRLAHWRVAGEEINYRRFFDINELAAIRVEEPEVFEEAHRLAFRWLGEGRVTGLRIDHPDGLFDPTAYFLNLQERFFVEVARARHGARVSSEEWPHVERGLKEMWREEIAADPRSPLAKALYVVVEKIQGGRERIPDAWVVHGTTGYRFACTATGIFVDTSNEPALTAIYERFVGRKMDMRELVRAAKQLIMSASMASEINVLARELNRISEMDRRSRDFTLSSLHRALCGFIAEFPVYRTYVDGRDALDARDVTYIRWTIARAKFHAPDLNSSIFDFLESILLRRVSDEMGPAQRAVMLRFAMKVQQVTGPVMAKALEDTVFYIYNRLTSLNEVGGEPERFGASLDTFHLRNQDRAENWPSALLATSTHDTKRSEDVRARLNVLSEIPAAWRREVRRFARFTRKHKTLVDGAFAPDANEEYLFYQTLLGAWPMGEDMSPDAFADFRRRVREYMLKAAREAKVNTSWTNPRRDYEDALAQFVERAMDAAESPRFLTAAKALKETMEGPGQVNALGQVICKLGSPGVPDIYQGCELWDLSLVDPDNRRPVDFGLRAQMLADLDARAESIGRAALCQELWRTRADGRAKLYLTAEGLRLRQRRPDLFRKGDYRAADVQGPRAEHGAGFLRTLGKEVVVVVFPRLVAKLWPDLSGALSGAWLHLPGELVDVELKDCLSGKVFRPKALPTGGAGLAVGALLEDFPVAFLEKLE